MAILLSEIISKVGFQVRVSPGSLEGKVIIRASPQDERAKCLEVWGRHLLPQVTSGSLLRIKHGVSTLGSMCLDTYSPVGGSVLKGCGTFKEGGALQEEVGPWGAGPGI